MVYLDNSATTKPSAEVLAAIHRVLTEDWGNPGGLYGLGLSAEKIVKEARGNVAASLGCSSSEVFFTSGGTESDNWVLKGVWEAKRKQGKRIISTAVEHPAMLRTLEWLKQQGADIVLLDPESDGRVSAEKIGEAMTKDTILVSVMHVNNETGAIMPLKEIRELMKQKCPDAYFHTDAVQSYGKLDCNVKALGVDFLSLSGHKVHGPKGVGALYIKSGIHLPVFIHGGGQEGGKRSGTENMIGIAGLGTAAEHIVRCREADYAGMCNAKQRLLAGIQAGIKDVKLNGPDGEGACGSVLNVSFIGCRGEVILHMLDKEGVCVSTGSACASHSHGSHVLTAMKLKPAELEGAVRFSFSADNTAEEIDYTLEKLKTVIATHRKLMKYHH